MSAPFKRPFDPTHIYDYQPRADIKKEDSSLSAYRPTQPRLKSGGPPIALGDAPRISVPQFLTADRLALRVKMPIEPTNPTDLAKSLRNPLLILVVGLVTASTVYFAVGLSASSSGIAHEQKSAAVGPAATILPPAAGLQDGVLPSQRPTDPNLALSHGGTSTSVASLWIALNDDDDTVMLGGRSDASTQPAPLPVHRLDPSEVQLLLQQGERFMAVGDVASARVVLHRAALAGNSGAALALAGTYDPRILSRIGVVGVTAEPDEARNWYSKAEQFGSPEALRQMSCFRIDNCVRDPALENLLHRPCL